MNIYEKLQKAKVELQKKDLKKTGENKFSHYTYYELGDFMPYINEICLELKIFTKVNFSKENATLTIINIEKPDEVITYESEMVKANLKGCNEIQALGGVQTYQRRYLYMNAFEISDNDYINNIDDNTEDKNNDIVNQEIMEVAENQLIDKLKKDLLEDAISKNRISDEIVYRILENYGYSSTAEIQTKDYMNIVKDFKKVVGQKE